MISIIPTDKQLLIITKERLTTPKTENITKIAIWVP